MQLYLKTLSGMSNIVDHDQTAGSALFVYTFLSATVVYKILGHLL